jgi:hypothetical protein
VFDRRHLTCTFYDRKDADCTAFSGPAYPDLDACNLLH